MRLAMYYKGRALFENEGRTTTELVSEPRSRDHADWLAVLAARRASREIGGEYLKAAEELAEAMCA